VRKPGKLPYETHSASYGLEYGTDRLEIHVDAMGAGSGMTIITNFRFPSFIVE
jgi:adenine phosphoribosyltransferase